MAGSPLVVMGFARPFAWISAYATVQLMEQYLLLSDCGGKPSKKLMKSTGKPPKNSTSSDTQQTSSDAETGVGTAVQVWTLGGLGTSSSTTWSSTGCHRSRPPLPSRLSRVAKSPPDHKVGTRKARCGPALLRAAGGQSRSSFLAESSACPKAWARMKEALSLSLCCFAT